MNSGKQIKIGAMLSYISIFANIIAGLIYTPWMIQVIGKSDYGLHTLAMSLINTFTIDFGLSMATQRYISKYLSKNDQEGVNRTVGIVYKLYFFITAVITIIFIALFFFIANIYSELSPAEVDRFKGLYIISAICSIITFPFITLNGMLSSYEKFIQLKICEFTHKIVTIALTVAALCMGYGVFSLVSVNLISGILFVFLRLIVVKKSTPIKPDFKYNDMSFVKKMFTFSIWTSISSLAIRFLLTLQPSILAMVSGVSEIAIFGYAVSLESYIYTFVNAINGFFLPKLSRISANNNQEESSEHVVNLMVSVGRFILLLFGLMFTGFLVIGKEFIILLVGQEYSASYYCTILICCYGIIAYPQQIANTYVMVKNKVKKRAIISLITIAICMVLSLALGKSFGAIGVSAAICIALFVHTFLMNSLYKNDLGIDIGKFFKNCHFKMLPGFVINLLFAYAISHLPVIGWTGFAIKIALICISFITIVWVLILNKQEKNILLDILKKVKKQCRK